MKIFLTAVTFFFVGYAPVLAQVTPAHTVIVLLENKSYDQIVGNADAPYINSLLSNPHAALFINSFGLTHPSQPNYLMLFSGSRQGVTDNNITSNFPFTTPNLGAEIIGKGLTFTGYAEGLPSVGSNVGTSGAYARKHNPWVNWQGTGVNGIPATANRPLSDFPSDFNLLPTLSFVIPNNDNNMHDGTIARSDAWLKANLDSYIKWCTNNNSLFILTFDEDDGSSSNRVLTIFIGADIKPGNYSQRVTHYNLLRTLEEIYALPYAGESADSSAIKGLRLSTQPYTYTFTGNGNWNDAGKWKNSIAPPIKTYNGSEIIIDPISGGECIINVAYTVSPGTLFKISARKKAIIKGNLLVR